MPTYSNETTAFRPSSCQYSGRTAPSEYDASRFADRHAVTRAVRNLQDSIGLTDKESLILEYLIANRHKYIGDCEIAMLMFGIFDDNPARIMVREHIRGIRRKFLNEFGVDPIRCDPKLGYRVAG
ncbi:MAG: hypothetical protein C3F11_11055 [Methylocystaceae bacterium]|nr:MAG: hypothetical protein C3F11_11055 [Methylocystaceae bacterium]